MRIDFTLTLPGLFEVQNIQKLADEFGVDVLAKVVFGFGPDIILSPLALPRELLDRTVDRLITTLPEGALKEVLLQLKSRPTFAEQWPDTYAKGIAKGKRRMLQLETIRTQTLTMTDILGARPDVLKWWMSIE
jgi:hypothetical protein